MSPRHPHAAAVDRLGRARIYAHFNITPQAVDKWKRYGVPTIHHKTLKILGVIHGVSMAELEG